VRRAPSAPGSSPSRTGGSSICAGSAHEGARTPVAPECLADAQDPTDYFSGLASEMALAHLAALPPEQAEIVLLRVVAGLDSNEVGAVTGKKPGTVRVLQKRALERLAALVADESRSDVTR
jgi:DNA-directed RNA polymerase specialized sigma24 family protein